MGADYLDGGQVRKCFVVKWTDFSGYGFNLHAEKGKSGQFVGKVDDESPAFYAGLKEGDRIVEVNDVNIGNENHQQVVTRIKAGGDSVWLLVVDKDGDDYCKNNKIVISHNLEQVKVIECPHSRPSESASAANEDGSNASTAEVNDPASDNDYEQPVSVVVPSPYPNDVEGDDEELPPPPPELSELDDAVNSVSAESAQMPEPAQAPPVEEVHEEPTPPAQEETEEVQAPEAAAPEESSAPAAPTEPEKPVRPAEPAAPVSQNGNSGDSEAAALETKMSAAEMREALARKKKSDPRNSKVSAKDKLKMFQNL